MPKMLPPHKLQSVGHVTRLAIDGMDKGLPWYPMAMAEIESICSLENWPIVDFTNKLAILSPRVSVRRNCRATLAYCGQGGLFLGGIVKSIRQSMANYLSNGKLGGQKIRCFASALMGDCESVTLDSWMLKALLKIDNPTGLEWKRVATRQEATKLVCKVAKRLSVSPRECQAMIWCGVFRQHGMEPQAFPLLQEYDNWVNHNRLFSQYGTIATIPQEELNVEEVLAESVSFEFGYNVF